MTSSGERILDLAEPSPAAEAVAGNGDLLREILLRLPVKSLLRFESVSKEWLSLITNPHFAQNYTRRHNPNLEPSGLLLKNLVFEQFQFVPLNDDGDGDGDGAESRVKLSYPADPGIMISQSCNGLLLCYYKHWKENNSVLVYYICNPTTKQFAPIYLASREFEASLVAVNLAFDPLKSPHYKLIFIRVVDEPSFTYQIDIYYSETPHLRPPASGHPLIFTAPPEICFRGPVHCNGIIHWNSRTKTSLCFDADTEQLYSMPMPPFPDGFQLENNCFFVESRGHLHLVVMDVPPIMEFDIWELKTDYSGWFIRYRVDLYPVAITFPEIIPTPENGYEIFRFLSVVRAEKEEDSTLVIVVAGEAISFNLNDKTSKKICDILVPWYKVYGSIIVEAFHAHQYIEMLFRV